MLYDSELDVLLSEARAATDAPPSAGGQRELAYWERHRARMDYRPYRAAGWFMGSGVVEAGCQRVIGQRLKPSGLVLVGAWRERHRQSALCVTLRRRLGLPVASTVAPRRLAMPP